MALAPDRRRHLIRFLNKLDIKSARPETIMIFDGSSFIGIWSSSHIEVYDSSGKLLEESIDYVLHTSSITLK